jgi:hypothetical protein
VATAWSSVVGELAQTGIAGEIIPEKADRTIRGITDQVMVCRGNRAKTVGSFAFRRRARRRRRRCDDSITGEDCVLERHGAPIADAAAESRHTGTHHGLVINDSAIGNHDRAPVGDCSSKGRFVCQPALRGITSQRAARNARRPRIRDSPTAATSAGRRVIRKGAVGHGEDPCVVNGASRGKVALGKIADKCRVRHGGDSAAINGAA